MKKKNQQNNTGGIYIKTLLRIGGQGFGTTSIIELITENMKRFFSEDHHVPP